MPLLHCATTSAWAPYVIDHFDAFLIDHAACERKASAQAISLALHYSDKPELVTPMVALAGEEMDHFQQVYGLMAARGLTFGKDEQDPYVAALMKFYRKGTDVFLLDRLLVGGIVERRGCERFGLLAAALPQGDLKDFYTEITQAEGRHHGLFIQLAETFFPRPMVRERLDVLLDEEAAIVESLPIRAALH